MIARRKIVVLVTAIALVLLAAGCGGVEEATGENPTSSISPEEESVRTAVAGFLNTNKGFFDPESACRFVTPSAIAELRDAVAPDSVDAGSAMNCSLLLTSATLSLDPEQFREMAETPIESVTVDGDKADVQLVGVAKESPWVQTATGWQLDSLIETLPIPETSDSDDTAE